MAVSLDQPLFPVKPTTTFTSVMMKSVQSLVKSNIFQLAIVAFLLAFSVSMLARATGSGSKVDSFWTSVRNKISRVTDSVTKKEGVPMTFDSQANEGWGVCSLRAKKRLGKSSFVQYDFDLPKSDEYIHLDLGQELTLCCLDNTQTVTKGNFYLYHGDQDNKLGSFSILVPNKTPAENVYEVGRDTARFVSDLNATLTRVYL